ncbi:hypothetical protein GW17_00062041 [Ensete ventricosum]|nr:hypothetical protein GW17_00062041 [Ensete ventricosum]
MGGRSCRCLLRAHRKQLIPPATKAADYCGPSPLGAQRPATPWTQQTYADTEGARAWRCVALVLYCCCEMWPKKDDTLKRPIAPGAPAAAALPLLWPLRAEIAAAVSRWRVREGEGGRGASHAFIHLSTHTSSDLQSMRPVPFLAAPAAATLTPPHDSGR